MASTLSMPGVDTNTETSPAPTAARLLVCLPAMEPDAQAAAVEHLTAAFAGRTLLIAGAAAELASAQVQPLEYAAPRSTFGWVLRGGDYAATATLTQQHDPAIILLLGADAATLPQDALQALVGAVESGADLAVPRYPSGPHDALVTSALLYPLTRALFSVDIRFPLPVDAAVSPRLLQRLLAASTRGASAQNPDHLVWAVAEAAIAGLRVKQIDTAERTLPPAPDVDLNTMLATVAGSLFADIEAKATFWQRARSLPSTQTATFAPDLEAMHGDLTEVEPMVDNFRLASANLGEIWSLVLPPQSLLALKKLANMPADTFRFDPSLWARTAYDFALAFHGRSLNRGHLLGAMTPLYLAWVASHIRAAGDDRERGARLIEATALAFERERPYFVSRWRWPDRFNP